MNYLLKGGEFNNKGAEAMTLVALKNIYENDSNASVFLIDSGYYPSFEFYKPIIFIPLPIWNLRILCGRKPVRCYRSRVKDFINFFIPGKKSYFGTLRKTKELLKKIDIVIDISGFSFSSKWGDEATMDWLSQIDLMKKMGAKVWLMPQSFGPFDFISKQVTEYGKSVLSKCERIIAREESGYKLLESLGLTNITKMSDSVLLEKNFTPSKIIRNFEKITDDINVTGKHNIALVPNYRLIDIGGTNYKKILKFYIDIINQYSKEYNIYLVAHAGEDLSVCKKIKERFADTDRVIFIDHVMFSFTYEEFSKKMDFIIASRYHSIIHAYKEGVPAVVLGWADKYKGIVSELEQDEYLIDLNSYEQALAIVKKMEESHQIESRKIKDKLEQLQVCSCYDFLKEVNAGNK